MSSGMINQSNPEQRTLGLMDDLAELLRAEVFPTHLPLMQLIDKICTDPALQQVDLYSKYTRLAAVVGGDWITVKEELRSATRFGAPAFYCSISAMLAVFNLRRSRSLDELVSSLTELYNHISAGNKILNKQVENAITTMGKQMEHANLAEASIGNLNERVDNAITTMEKQEELAKRAETSITNIIERADHVKTTMEKQVEQVNKAEVSVTNIIERADHVKTTMEKQVEQVNKVGTSIANAEQACNAIITIGKQIKQENIPEAITAPSASSKESPTEAIQDNVDIVLIPGTTYRCKYGTLTIDDQSECVFNGSSVEAKSLALWFTLPVQCIEDMTQLMNLDHVTLISNTKLNLSLLHNFKHNYNAVQRQNSLRSIFNTFNYREGQWAYIY